MSADTFRLFLFVCSLSCLSLIRRSVLVAGCLGDFVYLPLLPVAQVYNKRIFRGTLCIPLELIYCKACLHLCSDIKSKDLWLRAVCRKHIPSYRKRLRLVHLPIIFSVQNLVYTMWLAQGRISQKKYGFLHACWLF